MWNILRPVVSDWFCYTWSMLLKKQLANHCIQIKLRKNWQPLLPCSSGKSPYDDHNFPENFYSRQLCLFTESLRPWTNILFIHLSLVLDKNLFVSWIKIALAHDCMTAMIRQLNTYAFPQAYPNGAKMGLCLVSLHTKSQIWLTLLITLHFRRLKSWQIFVFSQIKLWNWKQEKRKTKW